MASQTLTNGEQTNLWAKSANPNVSVGGSNCKEIAWLEGLWQDDIGPACWSWALTGGSAQTVAENPEKGTEALQSYLNSPNNAVRPASGPWAANNQAATAVLTSRQLRLPNGCAWGADGVRVPADQVANFTTWFYDAVLALSKHQAESNGFQVTQAAVHPLTALGNSVTAAGYYIFMYPEFGVVPQSQPDSANHTLYKPPVFDHWWVQSPATQGHFVSIETVTNSPLRLYRDTRIWAAFPKQVVVLTVDGVHPTMHSILSAMGVI